MTSITHTLGVSSPLHEDERARAAQKVLNGGNAFGKDFLQGAVDGVFGEETGRACIRAKFWLGYADKHLTPTYGPDLDSFLHGLEQPSAEMVKRTAARRKKAAQTPMREKALAEAKKQLGVKESPPGSNRVRFSTWFGVTGPWCAMFVSWCYVQAGSKAFAKGSRYAYVPYIVADARAGRNGLHVTRDPQPGDLVCFDWQGDGVHDHVGLFRAGNPGAFETIEGNTAVGADSDGGQVMERHRESWAHPVFVRVGR